MRGTASLAFPASVSMPYATPYYHYNTNTLLSVEQLSLNSEPIFPVHSYLDKIRSREHAYRTPPVKDHVPCHFSKSRTKSCLKRRSVCALPAKEGVKAVRFDTPLEQVLLFSSRDSPSDTHNQVYHIDTSVLTKATHASSKKFPNGDFPDPSGHGQ